MVIVFLVRYARFERAKRGASGLSCGANFRLGLGLSLVLGPGSGSLLTVSDWIDWTRKRDLTDGPQARCARARKMIRSFGS